VRPVAFDGEIGQQCPGLLGFEAGDDLVIQGHLHWSEQMNGETGHLDSQSLSE
jgi:hypothetical protein